MNYQTQEQDIRAPGIYITVVSGLRPFVNFSFKTGVLFFEWNSKINFSNEINEACHSYFNKLHNTTRRKENWKPKEF